MAKISEVLALGRSSHGQELKDGISGKAKSILCVVCCVTMQERVSCLGKGTWRRSSRYQRVLTWLPFWWAVGFSEQPEFAPTLTGFLYWKTVLWGLSSLRQQGHLVRSQFSLL